MRQVLNTVLASLLLSSAAMAQNIDATQPDSILNIARGVGSADLSTSEQGDPMISGRIDGTRYTLFFFGCTNKVNCTSIQFYAGWEMENPVSTRDLNDWNRTKRYGRAYLDNSNDPVVEMDVVMEHGISRRNLEANFDLWKTVMSQFKQAINK